MLEYYFGSRLKVLGGIVIAFMLVLYSFLYSSSVGLEPVTQPQPTAMNININIPVQDVMRVQYERRQTIRKGCMSLSNNKVSRRKPDKNGNLAPEKMENFYVDDKRGIIYCLPEKAGSTSWKRALGIASEKITDLDIEKKTGNNQKSKYHPMGNVHTPDYLKVIGLKKLTFPFVRNELRNYFKVIMVREPYSRTLSAYQDKIGVMDDPIQNRLGLGFKVYDKLIRVKIRSNQNLTHHATFDEMLRYMGTFGSPPARTDHHFATITDLCLPCHIAYDYIVQLETLQQDLPYFFKHVLNTTKMNLAEFSSVAVGPSTKLAGHNSTGSVLKQFYGSVTPAARKAVQGYLKRDALLFGYDPDVPS